MIVLSPSEMNKEHAYEKEGYSYQNIDGESPVTDKYDAIVTRCTKIAEIGCTYSKKLAIVYAAIKELEDHLLAISDVEKGKSGESSTAGQNTNESLSQEHMNSQNMKDPEGGNRKGRPPIEHKKEF
ncbi:hypothetical protein Scep_016713 [Stephania cephalantha]|uniref:Uncharacterized protein n=1 Tax=Stephania cephalantha TaxID=152367 RepID=A0AAP0IP19_9MAGN